MKLILAYIAVLASSLSGVIAGEASEQIKIFIELQQKVYKIAKDNPNPCKPKTADLNAKTVKEVEELNLKDLSSEQLWRLGIACSVSDTGEAENKNWDRVFDDVCWRCVKIISSRPGHMNTQYLRQMKALFGTDGGPSLWFKEYIEKQEKLRD